MSAVGVILLVLAFSACGGVLYALRDSFKQMGASEEREKATYRKVEGVKKANEATTEIDGLNDESVRRWMQRWTRK